MPISFFVLSFCLISLHISLPVGPIADLPFFHFLPTLIFSFCIAGEDGEQNVWRYEGQKNAQRRASWFVVVMK